MKRFFKQNAPSKSAQLDVTREREKVYTLAQKNKIWCYTSKKNEIIMKVYLALIVQKSI
jgi:RecA-family ATPase